MSDSGSVTGPSGADVRSSTERSAVGVDWCNGRWLGVVCEEGSYEAVELKDGIEELYDAQAGSVDRLLIDVPIGLFDRDYDDEQPPLTRACDAAARTVLGRRHSSVFNPPAREALEQDTYEAAGEENHEILEKGLQKQAHNIADCIVDVDEFLREDTDHATDTRAPRETVLEAHPEVCFEALAEDSLSHSKKTAAGLAERLDAIDVGEANPWTAFEDFCGTLDEDYPDHDVDVDDLLDAMVLAIAGCAPDDEFHRLPGEDPPTDSFDLPMQMVYRADEPFPV